MWKEMHRLNPRANNFAPRFTKGIGPILFLIIWTRKNIV
jgi:hypothetical protein